MNTAWSGKRHAFTFAKYAHRYLAEVQYRFNHRRDLMALVTRLAVAVTRPRPCPKRRILLSDLKSACGDEMQPLNKLVLSWLAQIFGTLLNAAEPFYQQHEKPYISA